MPWYPKCLFFSLPSPQHVHVRALFCAQKRNCFDHRVPLQGLCCRNIHNVFYWASQSYMTFTLGGKCLNVHQKYNFIWMSGCCFGRFYVDFHTYIEVKHEFWFISFYCAAAQGGAGLSYFRYSSEVWSSGSQTRGRDPPKGLKINLRGHSPWIFL